MNKLKERTCIFQVDPCIQLKLFLLSFWKCKFGIKTKLSIAQTVALIYHFNKRDNPSLDSVGWHKLINETIQNSVVTEIKEG